MKMNKVLLFSCLTLAAGLCLHSKAQALVASPDLFGFDFRFSNPGARANAMGGAFIGLADDATAAYTNPAGLTVLTRSEVSVEYKQGKYTTLITDMAPQNTEYEKGLGSMSFISYANPQEKATITIFRHNMVNNESDFTWHDAPAQLYHSENHIELNGITYGLGVGYKLLDQLSLGLAVNFTQMEYLSTSTGIREDLTDPNNTHPEHIDNTSRASGNGTDEHFTVSLLWNVVDELNLGLVYRQGPSYTFTYNQMTWNGTDFTPEKPIDQELKVPDTYGIGLSYSLPLGLTLTADATMIKYSQLFSDILWENNGGGAKTYSTNSDFYMDDEWEYRAGLEYVMEVAKTPLALRAGYYFKPANYFKYRGTDLTSDFATNDWSRDDDHIVTAGVGVVLGENVQLDLAGQFGDYTTEGIMSLVYRLK